VFNAIFSNISAISWRLVLVVEEAGLPGENHRPWVNFITYSLDEEQQLKLMLLYVFIC
jgi:hypothetical protein